MSFKFFAAHYGGWLLTAFDSIPATKYTYRPTPAQQSAGYIAQYLEDANYGLCNRLGAMKHRRAQRTLSPIPFLRARGFAASQAESPAFGKRVSQAALLSSQAASRAEQANGEEHEPPALAGLEIPAIPSEDAVIEE
jgi:hypothetical protein